MPTRIFMTSPGGQEQEIKVYEECKVTLSLTNRAGPFSLLIPSVTSELVDAFPVGSDVRVLQDDNVFRGWVINPPKQLEGKVRYLAFEGADYTAKTQKIVVTESYEDTAISDIVEHLFSKYVPWASREKIEPCVQAITIRFPDVFLWDAMEQLCELCGYEWYIDEDLVVNFFEPSAKINPAVLSEKAGNYHRGSAEFSQDASKMVNKLWVKGGKALSLPFTQSFTVVDGDTPIQLFYRPRASEGESVTVIVDGVQRTVGIQYLDKYGEKDFLINAQEKLLVPDLCTSGSGTITYRYEYPIKILLEDAVSQATYGLFEDILKVETDDKTLAKEIGLRHLSKYSSPVTTGSIEPFEGTYKPGELVKIEIESLNINQYLEIKEVVYESRPGTGLVYRSLKLETPARTIDSILKDLNQRLMKLEKQVYNDSEGPVEKYLFFQDAIKSPRLTDSGMSWHLHRYKVCGPDKICGPDFFI
jgi:hypothetical protein